MLLLLALQRLLGLQGHPDLRHVRAEFVNQPSIDAYRGSFGSLFVDHRIQHFLNPIEQRDFVGVVGLHRRRRDGNRRRLLCRHRRRRLDGRDGRGRRRRRCLGLCQERRGRADDGDECGWDEFIKIT